MNNPITVTYLINEDDFLKACHVLWDHQAVGHRGNVTAGIGLSALGVILAVFGQIELVSYFLIVGGLIVAGLSFCRPRLWRRYYSKIEKYRAPIVTTFSEANITVAAHHETSQVSWLTFSGYVETAEFLFLLVDRKQFSIIPMDAFDQQSDVVDVLCLVSSKLPKVSKRRF